MKVSEKGLAIIKKYEGCRFCLLYTSDAADD